MLNAKNRTFVQYNGIRVFPFELNKQVYFWNPVLGIRRMRTFFGPENPLVVNKTH